MATDCWPALLDRLTAAQVANRLAKTRPGRRRQAITRLASGMCRCGRCGEDLLVMERENGAYYGCPARPTGCGGVYVKADHLEHWLVHGVLHSMAGPQRTADEQPGDAELERLLREEADALRALWEDYYVRQHIGRGEFLSARAGIVARFEAQRRELNPAWRNRRLALLDDPHPERAWLRLDVDDRRAVLEADVRAVVVNPARRRGAFDSRRLQLQRWENGGADHFQPCPEPATCVLRHHPRAVGGVVLDPGEEWLDGKQVARLLGISPRIVWDAIAKGLLRAERHHRRYRVQRADVTGFLRAARITLGPLIHRRVGQLGEPAAVKAPTATETWLSTPEAITMLRVTRSRLYRAIDDGAVPAYRFGRVIRIRTAELDDLPGARADLGASKSPGVNPVGMEGVAIPTDQPARS